MGRARGLWSLGAEDLPPTLTMADRRERRATASPLSDSPTVACMAARTVQILELTMEFCQLADHRGAIGSG